MYSAISDPDQLSQFLYGVSQIDEMPFLIHINVEADKAETDTAAADRAVAEVAETDMAADTVVIDMVAADTAVTDTSAADTAEAEQIAEMARTAVSGIRSFRRNYKRRGFRIPGSTMC